VRYLPRLSQGRTQGRPKCAKIVLKWRAFWNLWVELLGKRLKIDEYMQRGVLQALNPLSKRVTFTAIVPGAYPEEAKTCLRRTRDCLGCKGCALQMFKLT